MFYAICGWIAFFLWATLLLSVKNKLSYNPDNVHYQIKLVSFHWMRSIGWKIASMFDVDAVQNKTSFANIILSHCATVYRNGERNIKAAPKHPLLPYRMRCERHMLFRNEARGRLCARFANCTKHIAENRYPNDNRHSKLESVGTEKESHRIRNRENRNSHWMFSSQENCTIKFGDFDRKHSVFEHSSRWTKHQIYRCCFSTYSVCLRKMNFALWNWSFVAKYSIEFPDHRKESFNKIKFIFFFARVWQLQAIAIGIIYYIELFSFSDWKIERLDFRSVGGFFFCFILCSIYSSC